MLSIEDYASVDEVLRQFRRRMRIRRTVETIAVTKSYGRVAAAGVSAAEDFPNSSMSHMDGFAVRAEDLQGARNGRPVSLANVGALRAGAKPGLSISRGEASRISTGAPLPVGADTVIPVERVKENGGRVAVDFAPETGSFVYPRGTDLRKGERVIGGGQQIRAQDVGLLLMLGQEIIKVFAKPRVAILATGSELTNRKPRPGKVMNSHSPVFFRLVEQLGCEPVDFGIARDSPSEVSKKVKLGLEHSDFVITLGGTSIGRHDVVGEAVSRLHPELEVHGVKMDRGRVAGLALAEGKPILMAPGPIQGAMNAFILFGTKIIEWLSGNRSLELEKTCKLESGWQARKRFQHFTKVLYVKLDPGKNVAQPLLGDTESMKLLSQADGYIIVPEKVTRLEVGNEVRVRLLPGFSFA